MTEFIYGELYKLKTGVDLLVETWSDIGDWPDIGMGRDGQLGVEMTYGYTDEPFIYLGTIRVTGCGWKKVSRVLVRDKMYVCNDDSMHQRCIKVGP